MEHLPLSAQKALEGRIDPLSQQLISSYSQTFFAVLTALSFVISYASSSVLLGLEVFAIGFALLLIAAVPAWPYLNRYPVKFLPPRKLHST